MTLEIKSRWGDVIADNADGNSKEDRMVMETRICIEILEDDKW